MENPLPEDLGGDLPENFTHTFLIKIWLEETAAEVGQPVWRGHATHVASGQRRYIKRMDEIVDFILPYLETMGVRPPFIWRVRRRLKNWHSLPASHPDTGP